jgi:hypothetical protein
LSISPNETRELVPAIDPGSSARLISKTYPKEARSGYDEVDTSMSAVTEQPQPEALGGEVAPAAAPGRVVSGQNWAGKYQIGDRVGGSAATWYRAVELAGGREVLVRVWSLAGGVDGRQKIFEQVRTLDCPHVQRPIEEQVTEWELVQVWEALSGTSLHAWRTEHNAPDPKLITELVRQVGAVVEALQRSGWGHFGLDPDWVYLHETPEGPRFTVGGVDRAEVVERGELIAIEADPLYAPPETAGLYKHTPGSGLLAWDWWSLGRLVQQFVTGRHAVELLPDAIKTQLPRGLRGQAEALLFERTTGAVRAGAVECMTALEKRLDRLLRGLLTSSAEGRWGAEEVRAWLAGEMPSERYDASRNARYFRVDGRSCTADEAADRLLGPEHCERVVFHAMVVNQPWTLAKFLSDSDEHRQEWKQLQAVTELENASALSKVMPKLRKLIAATLGLHVLAGRTFRWRGRVLNAENLREALGRPGDYAALRTELIALADPIVISQIRRHDHAASQLLEALVKRALEAEAFLAKQVGLAPAALGDPARLWLLALESEATLEATRGELKTRYAETSNVAVEKLLAVPHPTPTMLLVLARIADDAPRFGFLTHEEVRQRRLAQLLEQERSLAEVVFWRRLGTAMTAGPMVFGRRWLFAAAITGGILLLAVHAPGPMGLLLGLGPAAVAIILRLLANRHQAGVIAEQIKDAAPWGWRDGVARCGREAAKRAMPVCRWRWHRPWRNWPWCGKRSGRSWSRRTRYAWHLRPGTSRHGRPWRRAGCWPGC